jgi:RNA recognition motif-containing protein
MATEHSPSRNNDESDGRLLWVGGIHSNVSSSEISRIFGEFGKIELVEAGFQGFAFVKFEGDYCDFR